MALAGARLGVSPQRAAPNVVRERPAPVSTGDREGPFYETAGGIPVSKPFYRNKISIEDYLEMRKKEYGEDLKDYRLGEVITGDKKDA